RPGGRDVQRRQREWHRHDYGHLRGIERERLERHSHRARHGGRRPHHLVGESDHTSADRRRLAHYCGRLRHQRERPAGRARIVFDVGRSAGSTGRHDRQERHRCNDAPHLESGDRDGDRRRAGRIDLPGYRRGHGDGHGNRNGQHHLGTVVGVGHRHRRRRADARHHGPVTGSAVVSHTYRLPGAYTITATVTDASGFSVPVSTGVTVNPTVLGLTITPPTTPPGVGLPATFTIGTGTLPAGDA